jgi:hypothetical protein
MDSFRQVIFEFITKTPERFQTAYEISQNWDEICKELVKRFQVGVKANVQELLRCSPEINEQDIDIDIDAGYGIWVSKQSWKNIKGDHLICIGVEGLCDSEYWGVFRNSSGAITPEIVENHDQYWRDNGLLNSNFKADWFFREYSASSFKNIASLTELLKDDTRQPLLESYSRKLAKYFTGYHNHIDKMIAMMKKEQ